LYLILGGTIIPASTADIFSRGYTWAAEGHADVMSSSWGLNSTWPCFPVELITEAIDSVHANRRYGKGIALFPAATIMFNLYYGRTSSFLPSVGWRYQYVIPKRYR
jgi:hypothetical protein